MSDELAYSGLKVLYLSQGVAGPHCGMLLARHGADVVKLEPLAGDWGRQIGKTYGDNCAYGMAFNRGKRSLALDLKNPEGAAIALRLARDGFSIMINDLDAGPAGEGSTRAAAAAAAGPLRDEIIARVDGCFMGNTN